MRIVPQGSSITGYIKETRLVKKTKKRSLWQEGTNREFLTKEPRPPPRVHRRKLFFRANTARKEMLSCTRCLIKTKEAKEGRAFFLGAREKKGRERKRRRIPFRETKSSKERIHISFFFFDSKFFDYKTTSYFVFLMLTDELSVQLQLTTRH